MFLHFVSILQLEFSTELIVEAFKQVKVCFFGKPPVNREHLMIQRSALVRRDAIIPTWPPREGILKAYSPFYKILSTHGSLMLSALNLCHRESSPLACLPSEPSMVALQSDPHSFLWL